MNTHSAICSTSRSVLAWLSGRAGQRLAPLVLAVLLGSAGCERAASPTAGSRSDDAAGTTTADDVGPASDAVVSSPQPAGGENTADGAAAPADESGSRDDRPDGGPAAADEQTAGTDAPSGRDAAAGGSHDGPGLAARSATRTTARSSDDREPIEIIFEDIQLPIQADMVFRPFMLTERVRELDGKRIRIHGYMLPDSKTRGITQFVLLKNTECKFGPGGQADHLINVLMTDGVTARYREDPITVEGILKINPFEGPDGNTWSIYDLACDKVESYRRR